jgi:cation diffusion facilitator CzcD-associated flavoprotein CzcO
MPSETDVIVIGAGQSGLAAVRALQARGVHPVVLEEDRNQPDRSRGTTTA